MAGHSKWANIQHRKKAQDNKRGKVFTKVIREITVATKLAGPDVNSNSRLRLALSRANSANVPKARAHVCNRNLQTMNNIASILQFCIKVQTKSPSIHSRTSLPSLHGASSQSALVRHSVSTTQAPSLTTFTPAAAATQALP